MDLRTEQEHNYCVLRLSDQDFEQKDLSLAITTSGEARGHSRFVIDLSAVDVITRHNFNQVEALCKQLELLGQKAIVCGINPASASVLANFIDSVSVDIALNVKHAAARL